MSAWLPTELRPVAGALALVLVWPHLKSQASNARLVGEAFSATLVAVAIVWVAWIVLRWWRNAGDDWAFPFPRARPRRHCGAGGY
jgi:hypothetical protein